MTKKVKRPSDWSKVHWDDTRVIAFDPAIANTGWALVGFFPTFPTPVIGASGTYVTKPEDGSTVGILGSLERGDRIFAFADALLKRTEPEVITVHETPVNQSNVDFARKAEAGPVSAMAVRAAMRNNGFEPVAIEVQTWKKLVCNKGSADTREVALALTEIFPNFQRSNEHVRAAIGCALGFMIKAERWTEDG